MNKKYFELSQSSIKAYESNVKQIYTILGKKIEEKFSIDDLNNLINYLKNHKINKNTMKNYLNSLIYKYKIDNRIDIPYYNKLRSEMLKIKQEIEKKRGDNKITKGEKEKYVNFEVICRVYMKIRSLVVKDPNNLENILDFLLISLYILIPPRRADYYYMKIITSKKTILSKDYNYYVNYGDQKPKFIFNVFKNAKNIKDSDKEIYINEKLNNVIQLYIKKFKLHDGDRLFKCIHSLQTYIYYIKRIFLKYINKPISIDILRHSYITYLRSKKKLETVNDKKEVSKQMAHSNLLQDEYFRKVNPNKKIILIKINKKKKFDKNEYMKKYMNDKNKKNLKLSKKEQNKIKDIHNKYMAKYRKKNKDKIKQIRKKSYEKNGT